jgi:hypothetical protein
MQPAAQQSLIWRLSTPPVPAAAFSAPSSLSLSTSLTSVHDAPAIRCAQYTQAIEMDGTVVSFYTNRAQAYIKSEGFGAALIDANMALSIDNTFVKASVPSSSLPSLYH